MNRNSSLEAMKIAYGWEFHPHPILRDLPFEKPEPLLEVALLRNDHFPVSVAAGLVYIVTIFSLRQFMKERKALELKWPLFWWNLGLGVFSILGFIRSAPAFVDGLLNEGFYSSVCFRKYMDNPTMFWSYLFCLSKFVELGDTVFIVLRKRPLVFLQWFHHTITMMFVWSIGMPVYEPVIRWYMTLNYGVHSLMYPYFALKAAGIRVPRWIADIITTSQFAQMIMGMFVNVISIYFKNSGYSCIRHPLSIQMSYFMYGSFVFLFGKLFVESVLKKKGGKRKEN